MEPQIIVAGVVLLGCATLCGFLAPSKGRDSGAWFVTGLLFGPFAIAALAFVGPLEFEDE